MKKYNQSAIEKLLVSRGAKRINFSQVHLVSNLILIAFLSIVLASCSKDDDRPSSEKKGISEEIKELIYFKGNENASTVIINAQSDPSTEFSTFEVDLIVESLNTADLLAVNVHQAQTLNPSILDGNGITLDQAIALNTESIEMLYKVVTYFKDQGRTVYVLGISFGAFITQELIAKKGIDSADKYLIITGRLDINDIIWQWSLEGINGFFENGVTPMIDPEPVVGVDERNLAKITAGIGMNRYTKLFKPIEDLSSVTYIYGATDEAVGRLTTEEIEFLELKNANIIAGSGNYSETFFDFITQGFKEAFGIE